MKPEETPPRLLRLLKQEQSPNSTIKVKEMWCGTKLYYIDDGRVDEPQPKKEGTDEA